MTSEFAADQPVRVAIVDDHESVRLGVAAAVESAGMRVVATADTVAALESALGDAEIEVLVLDLSLNDGSSITANVKWGQVRGSAVLVHSIADRVVAVREALAAGAAGVIPKSSPMSTVLAAVRTVAGGEVLNNLEWASAIDADDDFARAVLGRRERDVLHLYASGLPLKLVADRLQISVSTAKEYLDRIRDKYVEIGRPAPTKVDLLRRAVEDGILPGIDPDDGDAAR
ncbi:MULTISPECIES: response regulator transcription factor [unclassified Rathayibacter]|uniref:response regulator transcription factor n=1 Tax=unclassified Rathayibacter TaxID=2609250 RepID=UPI001889E704|nr:MULTISPECIES: response regulator transcription factor [unclassified Rathayibacter]MBF4461869.1 response regulator transcription factor [Rathayibacter sp. VKM Ac-2879]MBF4503282.1 response regulator transcription factor [Rathayibacter sp. VKM Ac-2878]